MLRIVRTNSWLALAVLVPGCVGAAGDVVPDMLVDASVDGDSTLARDASTDREDNGVDGGMPIDGGALDGSGPDTALEGGVCGSCTASGPCMQASCTDAGCVKEAVEDGRECNEQGTEICVDGACVPRIGCGDGYPEQGPDPKREACDDGNMEEGDACTAMCVPQVLVVSSRPEGEDMTWGPAPAVGVDGEGRALAVWSAVSLADSGTSEPTQAIYARRYSPAGVPQQDAEQSLVLRDDVGAEWEPQATVAGLESGGWVVAWTAPDADGSVGSIAVRDVSVDGEVGPVEILNERTEGHQSHPRIAALTGAAHVVVWDDGGAALSGAPEMSVIRARVRGGEPECSPELEVSTQPGDHARPDITASEDGFVVAWVDGGSAPPGTAPESPANRPAIKARRYDEDACAIDRMPLAITEQLASGVPPPTEPSLTTLQGDDSNIAVAWVARHNDSRGDVHARVLSQTGDPFSAGSSFSIATTSDRPERWPSVAALPDGGFVVAYQAGRQGGSLLRDTELVVVDGELPPEASALRRHIADDGIERDASVVVSTEGLWVSWSDDGIVDSALVDNPAEYPGFSPDHFRSVFAYLLPLE